MTTETAFAYYERYLAITTHFQNDGYDATKYNFKMKNLDIEKFRHKPIAFKFDKWAKKYSIDEFTNVIVAQCINGEKWGGLYKTVSEFELAYTLWRQRTEALTELFKTDLEMLHQQMAEPAALRDLFKIQNGLPFIIDSYKRHLISIETVSIVDKLTSFTVKCEGIIDPRWKVLKRLITKYQAFLVFDKPKFKEILLEKFPI